MGWAGIATKLNAAPPQALSLAMTFKRNTISFLDNIYPSTTVAGFWISMFVVLVTLGMYQRMRSKKNPLAPAAGVIISILTLFFLVLVFMTQRAEFFSTRYVIFMFPGVLLLLSIFTLQKVWPRVISLLLTAFLIPTGIWTWQLSPRPQNGGDWRGAAELVSSLYRPGDAVVLALHDPTMRSHFLHYLRKDMASAQLDTRVLSSTKPEQLAAQIQTLGKLPPRIIVFTHAAFQTKGQAMLDVLKTNFPCTPEPWQNVQSLRVTTVACEP